jgi:translation initiation factor 1
VTSNTRLVFSTDPKDQVLCRHCRKLKDECECQPSGQVSPDQIVAIFRLEKSGRGGKTVTVIDNLPRHETYLKDLAKELKAKCGVGGTHKIADKAGQIEIQGDQRVKLKAILDSKGIRYKGM